MVEECHLPLIFWSIVGRPEAMRLLPRISPVFGFWDMRGRGSGSDLIEARFWIVSGLPTNRSQR